MEYYKKIYHLTWVTYNNRANLEIGTKDYASEYVLMSPEMEAIAAKSILEILSEYKVKVYAINLCNDHVHLILECYEHMLHDIMRKVKGKSAQKVKDFLKLPATYQYHLWAKSLT